MLLPEYHLLGWWSMFLSHSLPCSARSWPRSSKLLMLKGFLTPAFWASAYKCLCVWCHCAVRSRLFTNPVNCSGSWSFNFWVFPISFGDLSQKVVANWFSCRCFIPLRSDPFICIAQQRGFCFLGVTRFPAQQPPVCRMERNCHRLRNFSNSCLPHLYFAATKFTEIFHPAPSRSSYKFLSGQDFFW